MAFCWIKNQKLLFKVSSIKEKQKEKLKEKQKRENKKKGLQTS